MAFTTLDLENIEKAIAQGARRVRLGQREKEYHSIEQMQNARDLIVQELNRSTATTKRPTTFYSRTSKGL